MWLLQICCSIKACLAPSAPIAPETSAASSDFLVPAPVYASAAYFILFVFLLHFLLLHPTPRLTFPLFRLG